MRRFSIFFILFILVTFQNCSDFSFQKSAPAGQSVQASSDGSANPPLPPSVPPVSNAALEILANPVSIYSGFDAPIEIEIKPTPTAPLELTVSTEPETATDPKDYVPYSRKMVVLAGQNKVSFTIKTIFNSALATRISFKVVVRANNVSGESKVTILPQEGAARFKSVSAGRFYTCGVTAADRVRCWPMANYQTNVININVEFGQMGGRYVRPYSPVDVAGTENAAKVFAGHFHNCVLLKNGQVRCWGANWSGQLGDGTRNFSTTAVEVKGLINPIDIRTNSDGTCALAQDRKVYCWGDFGLTDPNWVKPVAGTALYEILNFSNAHGIADTGSGFCIINSARKLFCWKSDTRVSQFGVGNTTNKPTEIPTLTDLEDVIYLTSGLGTLRTNGQSNLYAPQFVNGRASNQTQLFAPAWNLAVVGYTRSTDSQLMISYIQTPTQLALDPTTNSSIPLKNLRGLTSGQDHLCAWTQDYRVICFENASYNGTGDRPVVVQN